jgi:hypothetical protein
VALPFGSRTPENKRGLYRKALDAASIQAVEKVTTLEGSMGWVLNGGSDIDPAVCGAPGHPRSGALSQGARARSASPGDLPGTATAERRFRGTPVQHSRLRTIPEVDELVVNSRHHQCVEQVASGLVVAARAPDNVVEALERPGKRSSLRSSGTPRIVAGGPDGKLFEALRDAMGLSSEN